MTKTEKKEFLDKYNLFIGDFNAEEFLEEYGHFPKDFAYVIKSHKFDSCGALITWSPEHYLSKRYIDVISDKLKEKYPKSFVLSLFCGTTSDSYYTIWFDGNENIKEAAKYIEDMWNSVGYGQPFDESLNIGNKPYLCLGKRPALDIETECSEKPDACNYYSISIGFDRKYIYDEYNNKYILPITDEEKEAVKEKMKENRIFHVLEHGTIEEREKIIFDEKIQVFYDDATRRLFIKRFHFYKDISVSFPCMYVMTLDENGDPECIEDTDIVYKDVERDLLKRL